MNTETDKAPRSKGFVVQDVHVNNHQAEEKKSKYQNQDSGKSCSVMCRAAFAPSAPKRRHIGGQFHSRATRQNQEKSRVPRDFQVHPRRKGRQRSKTRSCSDACPEALRSALDRSAAEGGGLAGGARVIGRGGAHGATASRFPVFLARRKKQLQGLQGTCTVLAPRAQCS